MAVNDIVMGAAGASAPATYIEDVFSTWLYTGNGSTQTITNGIDLSGKGGMTWIKSRSAIRGNALFDTVRGSGYLIGSDSTAAQSYSAGYLSTFNSNGFSLGANAQTNFNGDTFASWTFREQPKFFDIVTYTGNGTSQNIAHNLGSVPGCMIIKNISNSSNWRVYHRSLGNTAGILLNSTAAQDTGTTSWNSTTPTATQFSVAGATSTVNATGNTYVAYLFAHDAGGFGLSGTENVISCGSYTGNGGTQSITLGYEPQWVMIKRTDTTFSWPIVDVMRGWVNSSTITDDNSLYANLSNAEDVLTARGFPNATGFTLDTAAPVNVSGGTYIYIAIRRPMKTPTTGTSVFSPNVDTSGSTTKTYNLGFPSDWIMQKPTGGGNNYAGNRLTGNYYLIPNSTGAESDGGAGTFSWDLQNSLKTVLTNVNTVAWNFRRASGFFDVVCYTGTGVARTVNHNLTVVPELMIIKARNAAYVWPVYQKDIGNTAYAELSSTNAFVTGDSGSWNNTTPTSSVFTVGTANRVNANTYNYVAYLFATVAGVSKVFSFTGNGSSQTINCSFTTGARFILIKRTDSTGDWYVWDSARGIVSGNDPHLSLNTTAAEVTTDDTIDPDSTGFIVNQVAATNVNVNGATYIGLAIA